MYVCVCVCVCIYIYIMCVCLSLSHTLSLICDISRTSSLFQTTRNFNVPMTSWSHRSMVQRSLVIWLQDVTRFTNLFTLIVSMKLKYEKRVTPTVALARPFPCVWGGRGEGGRPFPWDKLGICQQETQRVAWSKEEVREIQGGNWSTCRCRYHVRGRSRQGIYIAHWCTYYVVWSRMCDVLRRCKGIYTPHWCILYDHYIVYSYLLCRMIALCRMSVYLTCT